MRQFEFRLWDFWGIKEFNMDDVYLNRVSPLNNADRSIIMQYAGLKDKNDKKIFEGDILEFSVFDHNGSDTQYRGVVKFSSGKWELWHSVNSEFYGADGGFELYWVHQQDDEIEIVGNMYQNPEYLMSGKGSGLIEFEPLMMPNQKVVYDLEINDRMTRQGIKGIYGVDFD